MHIVKFSILNKYIIGYCMMFYLSVLLYYTGHGEMKTGNWNFQNDYLKFKDIYDLYNSHFKGKTLYIVSDCCHSGQWVLDCATQLDSENIYCGHDAEQCNILIKVFAACLPDQMALNGAYTKLGGFKATSCGEYSNFIGFAQHRRLRENQITLGFDFTNTSKACTLDHDGKCKGTDTTWEQDIVYLLGQDPNTHYII